MSITPHDNRLAPPQRATRKVLKLYMYIYKILFFYTLTVSITVKLLYHLHDDRTHWKTVQHALFRHYKETLMNLALSKQLRGLSTVWVQHSTRGVDLCPSGFFKARLFSVLPTWPRRRGVSVPAGVHRRLRPT